jgi:hypothetical protein
VPFRQSLSTVGEKQAESLLDSSRRLAANCGPPPESCASK